MDNAEKERIAQGWNFRFAQPLTVCDMILEIFTNIDKKIFQLIIFINIIINYLQLFITYQSVAHLTEGGEKSNTPPFNNCFLKFFQKT